MNKIYTIVALLFLSAQAMNAQEYVEVAVGALYSNQVYYTINDNAKTTLDNQDWDLAFTLGQADVGVLINESTDHVFTGSSPELKLYFTYEEDFSAVIDASILTDSIYNDEVSWQSGAFNQLADAMNPFDFGWGTYNPANHVVTGQWVYALKLRDDSWKKIKIESLSMGIYTVKYADLDGANEVTLTINQADYDSPMAYFSFATGEVTASPSGWDFVFQRYLSPIPAGAGGALVEYPTVGLLSAPGIEVAEVRGVVDPSYDDYIGSLEATTDLVGYDWKEFDLGSFQWVIESDLTYFVKMEDNQVWKVVFTDFEGSSTGNIVFQKTDLGIINAILDPESNFKEAGVFPNPIEDDFTVTFSLKEARNTLSLQLVNALGQTVWTSQAGGVEGFNAVNFQAPNVPSGYYQIVMGNGSDVWTTPVILK